LQQKGFVRLLVWRTLEQQNAIRTLARSKPPAAEPKVQHRQLL
jgi:hypothetical protein